MKQVHCNGHICTKCGFDKLTEEFGYFNCGELMKHINILFSKKEESEELPTEEGECRQWYADRLVELNPAKPYTIKCRKCGWGEPKQGDCEHQRRKYGIPTNVCWFQPPAAVAKIREAFEQKEEKPHNCDNCGWNTDKDGEFVVCNHEHERYGQNQFYSCGSRGNYKNWESKTTVAKIRAEYAQKQEEKKLCENCGWRILQKEHHKYCADIARKCLNTVKFCSSYQLYRTEAEARELYEAWKAKQNHDIPLGTKCPYAISDECSQGCSMEWCDKVDENCIRVEKGMNQTNQIVIPPNIKIVDKQTNHSYECPICHGPYQLFYNDERLCHHSRTDICDFFDSNIDPTHDWLKAYWAHVAKHTKKKQCFDCVHVNSSEHDKKYPNCKYEKICLDPHYSQYRKQQISHPEITGNDRDCKNCKYSDTIYCIIREECSTAYVGFKPYHPHFEPKDCLNCKHYNREIEYCNKMDGKECYKNTWRSWEPIEPKASPPAEKKPSYMDAIGFSWESYTDTQIKDIVNPIVSAFAPLFEVLADQLNLLVKTLIPEQPDEFPDDTPAIVGMIMEDEQAVKIEKLEAEIKDLIKWKEHWFQRARDYEEKYDHKCLEQKNTKDHYEHHLSVRDESIALCEQQIKELQDTIEKLTNIKSYKIEQPKLTRKGWYFHIQFFPFKLRFGRQREAMTE